MALLHRATLTPSKLDLLTAWLPNQPWGPDPGAGIETVAAFRFDDPDGQVGMETHLVVAGDDLFQVPFTYRNEPLADAGTALVGTTEHSALGTRWVYDGLHDPQFVMMLAASTLTGQGIAASMIVLDGRWCTVPNAVRVEGGGWTDGRAPVDHFVVDLDGADATLYNDRFDLTVARRPRPGDRPPVALVASGGPLAAPVVLATATPRPDPR